MKKYLFILLFLGGFIQKPFAQTFPWADTANFWIMSDSPIGCGVCTDDSDNVFVTGNAWSSHSFSLRKYNSNGLLRWSKTGTAYNAVATDAWGNCYATGGYLGSPFFEKYNRNGVLIHNYSNGYVGNAISYDGGKYLYITGSNAPNLFILKCDTAGNVIWSRTSIAGKFPSECSGLDINANSNGLIYITGYFADSVLLGTDSLHTSLSQIMAFVACYDSNGNVKWAHSTGRYSSSGNAVSSDGGGNVYITGSASTYAAFFIAKYTSAGDSVWWRQCASSNGVNSWGYGIATNSFGISYVTGAYEGEPFGSVTLNFGKGGDPDIFIVEYDSSGNAIWGYDPNDTDPNSVSNYGCSIAVDKYGCNFYFTGITESPAQFGNTFVDEFYLTKLNNGCVTGEQNQTQPKEAIQVYPNPFASSTTILFSEGGKHQLILEDITGRILQQLNIIGQQYELQRGNLASGIYFIKSTDAQNNVSVSKILVQ